MGKEILTFGDIEIEKNKFYSNIEISTLLVTCIIIVKLIHYI